MPHEHIEPTLQAIREGWFIGPDMGPSYCQVLTEKLNLRADRAALDAALALGGYLIHTEANKRHRHAIRAVLLATFLMKNRDLGQKDAIYAQHKGLSLEALARAFTNLFPAFFDNGKRAHWGPGAFTEPGNLGPLMKPQDWTGKQVPPYQFFVHTLKHPSDILDAPISTISRWIAISMSVLNSRKPVVYSNHGIIVRVPPNNVLTTSFTDQWFDNYAGTNKSHKVRLQGQSMAQHVGEKNIRLGGLMSPDEIVNMQGAGGIEAMQRSAGNNLSDYNEIVVCGVPGQPLPHGMTGSLQLAGVFIQTKMNGALPEVYYKSQGSAKQIEMAVRACAKNYHVPMLYLPTHVL